jgi:hypothetical protein
MTNNIRVAPIKTKNPVQANVMHTFSKVSMTLSPNIALGKLEIRGFSTSPLGARHIHRIIYEGGIFARPTPTEAAFSHDFSC